MADLVVQILNWLIPKRRQILVYGWPDHAPNAVAMVRAALADTDLDVIWMMPDPSTGIPSSVAPSPRLRLVKHHSVGGVWAAVRSKYVMYTHGLYGNRPHPSSQTVVQLWHGMPFKKIEALEGRHVSGGADWVVSAGRYWRSTLAAAFEVPEDRVAVTGMPRCDLLTQTVTSHETSALAALLGDRSGARTSIWLPTYRTSVTGDVRQDGTERGNPFQVPNADIPAIDAAFAATDTICLVKSHPMSPSYESDELSNVVFITDEDLERVGLDLYTLMAMTDLLLTDVSSVWLDYLVTGKPILFFLPDMDDYRNTRGMIDDSYEDRVPGPVVVNVTELQGALTGLFDSDTYAALREERRMELNEGSDGHSSLNVLRLLDLGDKPGPQ